MLNEARQEQAMDVDFGPIDSVAPVATPPDELLGGAATRAVGPRSNHLETALIFGASILFHLALAAHLRSAKPEKVHATRIPSKVEIEIAHQPPKVLPPEPPKPAEPPPPPKPQSHVATSRPTIPVENVAKMEGPASSEGADAPPAEEAPVAVGAGYVPEPPAPALQAPPPPPAPVIEAKEGANYLANPRPAYPKLASRQGWEGTVLLRVHVLPNGRPDTLSIQKSSGHDALDNAATDAVKSWTFSPATQGGKPIAGWVNVPIVFRLQ